jgi:hypothetical protein
VEVGVGVGVGVGAVPVVLALMLTELEYSRSPLVTRKARAVKVYTVPGSRLLNLYPGSGSLHGALGNPPTSCQVEKTPPRTWYSMSGWHTIPESGVRQIRMLMVVSVRIPGPASDGAAGAAA